MYFEWGECAARAIRLKQYIASSVTTLAFVHAAQRPWPRPAHTSTESHPRPPFTPHSLAPYIDPVTPAAGWKGTRGRSY